MIKHTSWPIKKSAPVKEEQIVKKPAPKKEKKVKVEAPKVVEEEVIKPEVDELSIEEFF